MKFSLKLLNKYVELPMGSIGELNNVIDRIALQIVDVDDREVDEKDAIIDIDNKIITNRPYAFGHRGLAREIAIMLSQDWSGGVYPKIPAKMANLPLKVTVESPELCPRFTAISIKGVKVGPSPEFIKNAIESLGLRSINNLVDITNLIMLDTAQPVHAYDYDKIANAKLIIRRANPGEKVATLDGVERSLNPEILLITDAEKAVGIGGVMGAGNSEIDENTVNILLEVAHFQPLNIRQTAKFLKHRTDAVTRFEKGIDPTNIPNVMALMIDMVVQICGGEVASDYVDINNLGMATVRHQPYSIEFNPLRVDKLLGFGIKEDEIKRILNGFGIVIKGVIPNGASVGQEVRDFKNISVQLASDSHKEGIWLLEVPAYRPDIKESADIIEDIGRMFGYQNIPEITPVNRLVIPSRNIKVVALRKIRKALNASSLDEVITYPFISEKDVAAFDLVNSIPLVNPLSNEYKYLRKTLTPSLSKVTGLNAKYFDNFGVFEIAKQFIRKSGEVLPYDQDHGASMQPEEIEVISMMFYSKTEKERGIFHLKAAFENLAQELGVVNYEFNVDGEIFLNNNQIGSIGLLSEKQLKSYELDYPASYLEVQLQPLLDNFKDTVSVKPFSKSQGSSIDYSLLVPLNTPVRSVEASVPNHPYITQKEIVDVYRGLKDVKEKKAVTIRLYLQKPDSNISANEVYDIAQTVEAELKKVVGLEIRGSGVQKPAGYHQSSLEVSPDATITEMDDAMKDENNKIVVGKILEITSHPNAERLVITKVDVGLAKPDNTLFTDHLQIVTGAKNISEGDIVPIALPGAIIPGIKDENGKNLVIKKGNLRGERSEGMMCSARELGHGDDHSGILILEVEEFGSKIGEVYKY